MISKITRIGIDLAKYTFSPFGVDECEHAVIRHTLKRTGLLGFLANLAPCIVAMEAGAGAHLWARQ
ncbi:MAG: hypothetical protein H6994_20550 [Pseudomonadales bacterium]|nr:hypothetical protein [Pseudomonadales bacterium]